MQSTDKDVISNPLSGDNEHKVELSIPVKKKNNDKGKYEYDNSRSVNIYPKASEHQLIKSAAKKIFEQLLLILIKEPDFTTTKLSDNTTAFINNVLESFEPKSNN